jgi:hypothetical protein
MRLLSILAGLGIGIAAPALAKSKIRLLLKCVSKSKR